MANDQGFKPGDVVQLKSGGPAMTYTGDSAMSGMAICTWFVGTTKNQETFDHAGLKPYVAPTLSGRSVRS